MNRRAFLARVPAAVAALPFLGGLGALAGASEPEVQGTVVGLEAEVLPFEPIYDEGRIAVIDGEFRQFYGSMQSGEWLALRPGLRSILVRGADAVIRRWDLGSGPPAY